MLLICGSLQSLSWDSIRTRIILLFDKFSRMSSEGDDPSSPVPILSHASWRDFDVLLPRWAQGFGIVSPLTTSRWQALFAWLR